MSQDTHRPDGDAGPSRPPESIVAALERAQSHAARALGEGAAATRALLDALSLSVSGETAEHHQPLADIARTLDQLAGALNGESSVTSAATRVILEALDGEISRWELRSRTDADARAVLRTFLGLREMLWEIGMRPEEEASRSTAPEPHPEPHPNPQPVEPRRDPEMRRSPRPGARRVQRITVQG